MKEHGERFTMSPPSAFAHDGEFLRVGDRPREVTDTERRRIAGYCRERLRDASYPVERFYPDLGRPDPP